MRPDGTSREHAYRLGAETVRDAAGENTYLLACGAPIIPTLGLFDGLRVGPDVAPIWDLAPMPEELRDYAAPATQYAISTSLHRLWLADLIAIDPDVVYFRTTYNLLSERERGYLQDLAHICDFVATSDPPGWLQEDEGAALHSYLAARPAVQRHHRYRFTLGDRSVNFGPVALDEQAGGEDRA